MKQIFNNIISIVIAAIIIIGCGTVGCCWENNKNSNLSMAINHREVFLFMDLNMNTMMMKNIFFRLPVRFSYVPGFFIVSIISIIIYIIIAIITRSGTAWNRKKKVITSPVGEKIRQGFFILSER